MPIAFRLYACLARSVALAAFCGAVSVTLPLVGSAQTPAREYVDGESDQYEIRVRVAGADSELFGVSEHRVVRENGALVERVRWVRAFETRAGDLSEEVQETAPLALTLDSQSLPIQSPTIANPAVQMLVDSLQQIYVAVNPSLGAAQLQKPGDTATSATTYVEESAENDGSLKRRAAALTFSFVSADANEAVIRTEFSPPAQTPWEPLQDWLTADCDGRPANFAELGGGRGFTATWGCEDAQATVRLSAETGKITRADLESRVRFHQRWCTDETLSRCGGTGENEMVVTATLLLKQSDPPLPPDRLTRNPTDGLEYAKAPAGTFEMGCVPDDRECYPREEPRHEIRISKPFWIGRTEVSVAAYERYVADSGAEMPPEPQGVHDFNNGWSKKDHPMVKVTWQEAQAYCAWAGGRLPTEAEWEYAARGGLDGLKYPWGNERSHDEANYWRSGGHDVWKHTAPVGSFPANGFGLYDMAGNVYEWTADWFDEEYYGHSPAVDPRGPEGGRQRAVRGGSGFINPAVLRVSTRLQNAPDDRKLGVGFRCVMDATP